MKQNLNLPPLFPFKMELQELTQQLSDAIEPDAIYLCTVRKEPPSLYALHLIRSSANEFSTEEITVLKQLGQKFPQFSIHWNTAGQVRKQLMAGDLYYISQCFYGELIYLSDNSKDPLAESTIKGSTLLKKAKEKTTDDFNKVVELFSATYDLFQKEKYDKATLKVIDILLVLFSYAETLYKGEAISAHSLSEHVKYLAALNSEFRKLFDPGNDRITEILLFLNDIDLAGLDPKEHKIYRSKCHEIFVLGEVVFQMVYSITEGIISDCHNLELQRNPVIKPIISGENLHLPFDMALQEVVDFLCSKFKVHSIFLLSKEQQSVFKNRNFQTKESQYHTFCCTVLLVTKKPVSFSPAELMDLVFNHTKKRIKVYFIFETLSKILDKLDYGNNFLDHVLKKSNSVFQADEQLSKFLNGKPSYYPQSWQKINKRWKARISRANYILGLADVIDFKEDLLANLVLVQNAIGQTCIGMLGVFWEYQPSYTSLPYLIHLCGNFCDFPKEILLNNSFQSQRIYYLITHAQQHINYTCTLKVTEKDTEKSYNLCSRFIAEAENMTEHHLDYLRMKSFQRNEPLYFKTS